MTTDDREILRFKYTNLDDLRFLPYLYDSSFSLHGCIDIFTTAVIVHVNSSCHPISFEPLF